MPNERTWPQDFDRVRAAAEKRLGKSIERLNRSARRRLLEAVDQFQSVEAIPQAVWDDIERDAFGLFLPVFTAIAVESARVVLDSLDAPQTPTLINAAVEQLSIESARATATAATIGLRKGVQRRALPPEAAVLSPPTSGVPGSDLLPQTSFPPSTVIAAGGLLPANFRPQTPGEIVEQARFAVREATDWESETAKGRIGRAFRTDATLGITNGAKAGAAIYQAANPHQRVTLVWRVRKVTGDNRPGAPAAENVCPICAPLEGLPFELWAEYFLGPPAHYGCQCEVQVFVAYVMAGLSGLLSRFDRR